MLAYNYYYYYTYVYIHIRPHLKQFILDIYFQSVFLQIYSTCTCYINIIITFACTIFLIVLLYCNLFYTTYFCPERPTDRFKSIIIIVCIIYNLFRRRCDIIVKLSLTWHAFNALLFVYQYTYIYSAKKHRSRVNVYTCILCTCTLVKSKREYLLFKHVLYSFCMNNYLYICFYIYILFVISLNATFIANSIIIYYNHDHG